MFMAHIGGYDAIQVFSNDREKAKMKAVSVKKVLCKDDLEKWSWEKCKEYYGAWVIEIAEGLVLCNNQ